MASVVDPPESELGLAYTPSDDFLFFQDGVSDGGCGGSDLINDVVLNDLDFDFSFDDISFPLPDELGTLLSPSPDRQCQSDFQAERGYNFPAPTSDPRDAVFKSRSSEIQTTGEIYEVFCDQSKDSSGVSPGEEFNLISEYLNMDSPESNGSNPSSSDDHGSDVKETIYLSPNSQSSKNLVFSDGTDVSPDRSVSFAPNCSKSSILTGVVDQKEEIVVSDNYNGNHYSLKRKNDGDDILNTNSESWSNKCRKSSLVMDGDVGNSNGVVSEEEEKRKARLMRNRESAQLSRQRKKHYVEELEGKVRNMHATIQDLNSKISYFMAENVALRQKMSGGVAAPAASLPPMVPPPPAMYPPHPAMAYPWMTYAPPYMVKSQGSQVPLVPIPRLKPQQPAQPPKKAETKKVESKKAEPKKVESKSVETKKVEGKSVETKKVEGKSVETKKVEGKSAETMKVEGKSVETKKVESKKNEAPKNKKVASVSLLGLLFFTMLFGCLVPLVNVRYGEEKAPLVVGDNYLIRGVNENHHRRVLMFNETECGDNYVDNSVHHVQKNHGCKGNEFKGLINMSEPLAASLYVPRNDKLVKIDGNLVIHSVLASEKAMASKLKVDLDSQPSLAVHGDLASVVALPGMGMHSHMRTLGSSSLDKDDKNPAATDGALQQWFHEGLAGPSLTAGMCTEVFQFDVSTAIVPATTKQNITENQNQNSTHLSKGLNRRFLHPFPFQESSRNVSTEHAGNSSEKDGFHGHTNSTSMVVSVLFDPRESVDADREGVMGTKRLSRIFVVVLVDSIKYVTYSCVLPFQVSAPNFVTA